MRFGLNLARTSLSGIIKHFRFAAIGGGVVTLVILPFCFANAHDRGQFASSSPEIKALFEGLKSGRGPCCSNADGTAVSDAD